MSFRRGLMYNTIVKFTITYQEYLMKNKSLFLALMLLLSHFTVYNMTPIDSDEKKAQENTEMFIELSGSEGIEEFFIKTYPIVEKLKQLIVQMFCAVDNNKIESLKDALDNGARISWLNIPNYNVLHLAVEKSTIDIIRLLLNGNIDTSVVDRHNKTALDKAKERGQNEIIDLLESYNVVLKESISGATIHTLNRAVEYNFITLAKQLIFAGVQPTVNNLEVAKKENYTELGSMLRHYLGMFGPQLGISQSGVSATLYSAGIPAELMSKIALDTL
jgi:Ankyrin repeats (3 copies)